MDELQHEPTTAPIGAAGTCPQCGRGLVARTTDERTDLVCAWCGVAGVVATPAAEVTEPPPPATAEPQPPAEPQGFALAASAWPTDRPTRSTVSAPRPPARPRGGLTWAHWALAVLLPCTLGLAGFIVLKGSELIRAASGSSRAVHPLEELADQGLYEDFLDARQKLAIAPADKANPPRKTTAVDPVATELPPSVPPVKLNETRKVGALAVTPLSVKRGRWTFSYRAGERNVAGATEGLLLTLRLTNTSDLIFHPNDATFNRALGSTPSHPVYTYLTLGSQRFYGPVLDPTTEAVTGQNFAVLFPGDSIETTVIAAQDASGKADVLAALDRLPANTPVVWRVHLRRGREEIKLVGTNRLRKVWLTTVVPVTFTPAEVQGDVLRSWFE